MQAVTRSCRLVLPSALGRCYSTFSYREIVQLPPVLQQSTAEPSGENLKGPAKRLFGQLATYQDPLEMYELIKTLKGAKHLQQEHIQLAMSRLSASNFYDQLNEMQSLLSEKSFESGVETYNNLLSSLFEQNPSAGPKALEIWKEMKDKKIAPNSLSYRTLVSGLSRCKGQAQTSFELLKEMIANDGKPDADLFLRVLWALVQENEKNAKNLLDLMNSSVGADVRAYNVLLRYYITKNNDAGVTSLLNDMKKQSVARNNVTWSLLIEQNINEEDSVSDILVNIKKENLDNDSAVLSSLVSFNVTHGKSEVAEEILQQIFASNQSPASFAYTDLLTHYANKGDVKRADATFVLMQEKGVTITEDHYLAFGSCLIEKGYLKAWDSLITAMDNAGIPTTVNRCNLHVKRIMYDPQCAISDAEEYIQTMKTHKLVPTYDTWISVVDGHCVMKDMDSAHRVVNIMKAEGLLEKADTYASLLAGYANAGNIKDAAPLLHYFSTLESKEYVEAHDQKVLETETQKE